MKKMLSPLLKILILFVTLTVNTFGGRVLTVSAGEAHHGMQEHTQVVTSNTDCQSKCSATAGTLPALTKSTEEEQDKDVHPNQALFTSEKPFAFVNIRKIVGVLNNERILRPPDIFAHYCIYRF